MALPTAVGEKRQMSRLTWADLLIQDLNPEESHYWLEPWSWLVSGPLAPEFLNKFGSWFFRRPEGHVEMLDVLNGTVEKVADSYDEFMGLVNQQWWQEVYLLSELVFRLHGEEKIPGPGQCYALAPHPAIGGPNPTNNDPIDLRFVTITDIAVWQGLCAQFVQGNRQ
jgi:hypothetical protein